MTAFETSEGPEKTVTKSKNWIKFGCIIPSIALGILLLVGLVYYGIGYILVKQVDSRYAGRDCTSLVDLAGSVEKVYPLKIAPFTEPALEQARECQAYLSAESLHEQKSWEKAYQAYVKYGQVYPKGIYTKEARELAANALFEWASTQHGSQDFANSVDNLTLLLNNYGDTPSMPKAKEVLPVVYLEWGEECRANGEFSEAESVYVSMNEWAVQEGDQAYATRAQAELSQAYFDWGKALQNEKNFTLAATKLDKAMSTDPDAQSANSLTAQTRAYLPGFQRAWGEYLIANGNYSEAIGHYQTSISLSSAKDAESAKNELTQAYLEWAAALRKKEDYNQALDKVDLADESAVTDASRGKAEDERATTISQFSQSKGTQAKKIISDTVKSICTDGKPIEAPPIIGVLDEKRLTVSGLSLNLPSNVLAQAPGNLYFVACTAEKEVTVQSCPFSRTGYGIATHWIKRIRYDWQFKIYNSQTGKLYREKTFAGSSPESCPYSHSFSTTIHYHYGDKPSTTTVVDWLASLLK
jgi:tetratricopeptide (TPR) repeat protein